MSTCIEFSFITSRLCRCTHSTSSAFTRFIHGTTVEITSTSWNPKMKLPKNGCWLSSESGLLFRAFFILHLTDSYQPVHSRYDLYTKASEIPDIEALWPYYQTLIDKYLPGELEWWGIEMRKKRAEMRREKIPRGLQCDVPRYIHPLQ